MKHIFGKRSLKQYETLHRDLQIVMDWGIKYCRVDFSIIEGHRPSGKQFQYFQKGRAFQDGSWKIVDKKKVITYIDGYDKKGKHNYLPSLAVDFCAHVPDKPELSWDLVHITYIAATLIMISEFLHEQGIITHKLTWGANWDRDGDLADHRFYDRPHLELYIQ